MGYSFNVTTLDRGTKRSSDPKLGPFWGPDLGLNREQDPVKLWLSLSLAQPILQGGLTACQDNVKSVPGRQPPSPAGTRYQPFSSHENPGGNSSYLESAVSMAQR